MANEKRLIDANELSQIIMESYERMDGLIPDAPRRHMAKAALLSTVDLIGEIPPVDAVEVVRCKDCKHFNVFRLECHNGYLNGITWIDGFCAYGERKGND